MYTYPYSKEGVSRALREIYNSDSPVIPETFHMIQTEGDYGGEITITYEFKTEDGCKYTLIAMGTQYVELFVPLTVRANRIISIKKI